MNDYKHKDGLKAVVFFIRENQGRFDPVCIRSLDKGIWKAIPFVFGLAVMFTNYGGRELTRSVLRCVL